HTTVAKPEGRKQAKASPAHPTGWARPKPFRPLRARPVRFRRCDLRFRMGVPPSPPPRGSEAVARGGSLAAGCPLVPSSAFGLRAGGGSEWVVEDFVN